MNNILAIELCQPGKKYQLPLKAKLNFTKQESSYEAFSILSATLAVNAAWLCSSCLQACRKKKG